MKKITSYLLLIAIAITSSCKDFDDSDIWDKLNNHEYRIVYLEEMCKNINSDIVNLQTIVSALEANDYIVNASPLTDGSGYVFIFKSSKSIIVQTRKDGIDTIVPAISVMKGEDGIFYWTVNGDFLLIDGEKVKASAKDGINGADGKDGINGADGKDGINGVDGKDGVDGITPEFKILNGYWYVTYDNAESWEMLGKATGSDGINGVDGDAMFKTVYVKDGYVCFELNDGKDTIIRIPLMKDGNLQVSLQTAGTLSKILTSEETRTTTMLSIKGNINEDDLRHIQIMNSLQKLDLSEAVCNIYPFKLNPYQDTIINKSIEEFVFPKSVGLSKVIDLSYCLALKKITVTDNYSIGGNGFTIKFCPNVAVWEYAEGVETCKSNAHWDRINSLEKVIYPSTMKKIPQYIVSCSSEKSVEVPGFQYASVGTMTCKTLVCKATIPPVLDTSIFASDLKFYYDSVSKGYYCERNGKKLHLYNVNVPSDAVLYVPMESINLYKSAPLWENFTDIRAIEDME